MLDRAIMAGDRDGGAAAAPRIRKIELEDAARVLALRLRLDAESRFMMLEPGERATSVEDQRAEIAAIQAQANSAVFLAEIGDGALAGYLSAEGGVFRRNRHVAYIVVGVLEEFAGRGIASALFRALEAWAPAHGIHRLELTVMAHNQRALRLYRRMGFVEEGTRRRAVRVDGKFVDELAMAKLIDL
jgi:RimJ/RimL family protein N-acetyltransferase